MIIESKITLENTADNWEGILEFFTGSGIELFKSFDELEEDRLGFGYSDVGPDTSNSGDKLKI